MELRFKTHFILLLLPWFMCAQPLVDHRNKAAVDSVVRYTEELSDLRPGQSLELSERLEKLGVKHNDSLLMADALLLQARAHAKLYHFQKASHLYRRAQDLYRQTGNSKGLSRSLTGLAQVEVRLGAYYTALSNLERALQISRKLDDPLQTAEILRLLAEINLQQNELEKARGQAREALRIVDENGSRQLRGQLYNTLAAISFTYSEHQKALDYVNHALVLNELLGQHKEIARAHATAAAVWHSLGNLSKALDNAEHAIELSRQHGFPYEQVEQMVLYSQILWDNNQLDQAIQTAERADSVANAVRRIDAVNLQVHQQLAELYLAARDSASALERMLQLQYITDSIKDHNISELLLRRDIESQQNKNKELAVDNEIKNRYLQRSKTLLILAGGFILISVLLIVMLIINVRRRKLSSKSLVKKSRELEEKQKTVVEQRQQLEARNAELENLDATKNKIFSVLTHDLRQPISQTRSIIDLLEVQDISGEERQHILSKLRESLDNSGNALENLLLWSKKQLTGINTRIVDVHLLPQLLQLESQVAPNLETKKLILELDVPDDFKIKADMNQLDICLRNLTINAIKFSKTESTITIDTAEDGEYKYVRIHDTGVGMDTEQVKKLQQLRESFSTLGTMNEKGTGLGVLITHEFMQNQNGKLLITSTKGEGSTFSMAFPKVNKGARRDDKKESFE